ncbi:MAG: hypothetical protein JNM17_11030 [Archangium sp.]|nr:hypothetical protein [Archangium sp.]
MSDARAEVVRLFKEATGRPVRWARLPLADFVGRDVTLDLFDVIDTEQRALFHQLASVRAAANDVLGREVIVVMHTPEATTLHYPEVRAEQSATAAR